ncbi:MAG: hypothetical protein JNJ48_04695 [Phycisphaerae bacterium]|nr:hypothetical protein [Phycisphaerae bacterium]
MNRLFLPVAAIVCCVSPVLAADKIDNPEYKQWSAYKAGTSVTMKTDSEAAGNKSSMSMTTKLVEVTGDKVVLETVMTIDAGGQKMDMPAQKRDVPAKIEKPAETKTDEKAPKPKTGEEEIEVAGKKYKAKWTETTTEQNGMKSIAKVWTSDEVPGTVLKMESKTTGAMEATSKGVVTEIKIVK